MQKIRKCPICNSKGHHEKLRKDEFNIVKCMTCSHIFVSNAKTTTESPFNKDISIDNYKQRHIQIINQIKLVFGNEKIIKIADIGAGYGHLGKLIYKEEKFDYYGFEPGTGRAEFCQKNGLNVVNQLFTISDNKYDVIIMDNVLEHVNNPIEIIDSIEKSLNNSGIFICIVPNVLDIRQLNKNWRDVEHWQPHCHINYFSYADLKNVSSKFNMKLKNFSLKSLPDDSSTTLKIKTFLDGAGVHVGGLYTYFIKP